LVVTVSVVAFLSWLNKTITAPCVIAIIGTGVVVAGVSIVAFFSSFNVPIAADRIGVSTTTSSSSTTTVVSATKFKGYLGSFKVVIGKSLNAVVLN
jgi:hypothetical protein